MVRRQPLHVTLEGLTQTSTLNGRAIPLVIEAKLPGLNLATWVERQASYLDTLVLKHGALLLRDFKTPTTAEFQSAMASAFGPLLDYVERSSPRTRVSGMIFSSTDYAADQSIFLHNEQSYNSAFPLIIAFFCEQPSETGGETPIADTRNVLRRLRPAIRERFLRTGYQLVRNYGGGCGLTWQTAFQTHNAADVDTYCWEHDIGVRWCGEELETRQHRPTIAKHPLTGELAWFNHMTFFHLSTLAPAIRRDMEALFRADNLPNQTYGGDGSPIEDEVVQELRDAYLAEQISFEWRRGDVLLLDNMLVAHGRAPYTGPRQVRVAMARPCKWADVRISDILEVERTLA